ncbi:coactosin-like protein [Acanthaster planci]|uniref:Coactosin-like protein n=1 Tax=Acanthaster planci TaxID=133434 RepID=A0A8B7ZZW9_ACAPL|nr:coactosin-like protein [Acanthaster planci]
MFRFLILACVVGFAVGSQVEELRYLLRALEMTRNQALIPDSEKLREMYEDVRRGAKGWCTATYDGKIIVPGDCGMEYSDLLDLLGEDDRCYAYAKFEVDTRDKFAFITWIGPSVSPLKKAKVSTDKAFVKKIWTEFTKEILADEKSDLKEGKIIKMLEMASGAAYGTGQR